MHKLVLATFMVLVLASSALAVVQGGTPIDITTGNAAYECSQAGYPVGIAKWEWDDDSMFVREGSDYPGYVTNVTGDQSVAYWTSTPAAAVILSKEAGDYFLYLGGTSGTIHKGEHDISHVTLCGNDEPHNDVPEFGILAAIGVLGLAGLFIARRRH